MDYEEFHDALLKLWTQARHGAFTLALVAFHGAILAGHWSLRAGLQLVAVIYHIIAVVVRRGWRIALVWTTVYMYAGIAWRVVHGLPLGDTVALIAAVAPMALNLVVAQVTRSVEVRAGVGADSSIGGMLGSMLGGLMPTTTIDGNPRPAMPA